MLTQPQLRILKWLNEYPSSLEKSWDVSRDLSLPGIAEGIGVVRSALNIPLRIIEEHGFVFKRMAHVIGGGSRRRQVYHLSALGREHLSQLVFSDISPKKAKEIFGNPPELIEIFGRDAEFSQALDILTEKSLVITGMPGIGKSVLVRKIAAHYGSKTSVRWASANEFTDYLEICSTWNFTTMVPRDIESISMVFSNREEVLIIDDFHLVDVRHHAKIQDLVEAISQNSQTKFILISRDNLDSSLGFGQLKIESLDVDSCCQMLGDDIELSKRLDICEKLGHHPLALKLYDPSFGAPESSTDIIDYVNKVVLKNLSEDDKNLLTHMSLEPNPVKSEFSIIEPKIEKFDMQSLLKWHKRSAVELQHLVRNITRSNLSKHETRQIHSHLCRHWENISADENMINYFYHLSKSAPDSFIEQISDSLDRVIEINSAALAVMIEDLIEQDLQNESLRYMACKIAADRYEVDYLKQSTEFLSGNNKLEIDFMLAKLEGRLEHCEQITEQLITTQSSFEANKLLISLATQILENRLPNQKLEGELISKVNSYLSRLDFSDLANRNVILVAVTMIKFTLALDEKNLAKAVNLLTSIESIEHNCDPVYLSMQTKIKIYEYDNGICDLSAVVEMVQSNCAIIDNILMSQSLKLKLIESLINTNLDLASKMFNQLTKPNQLPRSSPALRYCARWWLAKSQISKNSQKSSLNESIARYRQAGCHNAAKELESKLHSLL
jgi:hypothetical protein